MKRKLIFIVGSLLAATSAFATQLQPNIDYEYIYGTCASGACPYWFVKIKLDDSIGFSLAGPNPEKKTELYDMISLGLTPNLNNWWPVRPVAAINGTEFDDNQSIWTLYSAGKELHHNSKSKAWFGVTQFKGETVSVKMDYEENMSSESEADKAYKWMILGSTSSITWGTHSSDPTSQKLCTQWDNVDSSGQIQDLSLVYGFTCTNPKDISTCENTGDYGKDTGLETIKPRTAVGYDEYNENSKTVYFFVAGGYPWGPPGMDMGDVCDKLYDLLEVESVNDDRDLSKKRGLLLDGGSSSTLLINQEGELEWIDVLFGIYNPKPEIHNGIAVYKFFIDVLPQKQYWYSEHVYALRDAGVVSGYDDGSNRFRPGDTIDRAEFSKMVALGIGIDTPSCTTAPFDDVAKDSWYCPYIDALYKAGYVSGQGEGHHCTSGPACTVNASTSTTCFCPADFLNRAEASKIITNAFDLNCGGVARQAFSDVDDSAWYAEYVYAVSNCGVFQGYPDGSFKPERTLIRLEAAKVVNKSMKLQ